MEKYFRFEFIRTEIFFESCVIALKFGRLEKSRISMQDFRCVWEYSSSIGDEIIIVDVTGCCCVRDAEWCHRVPLEGFTQDSFHVRQHWSVLQVLTMGQYDSPAQALRYSFDVEVSHQAMGTSARLLSDT